MIEISNEFMSLSVNGEVIATARFSMDAAADGDGAWIVSTHPFDCSIATRRLPH